MYLLYVSSLFAYNYKKGINAGISCYFKFTLINGQN